jgi:hypothetical protein
MSDTSWIYSCGHTQVMMESDINKYKVSGNVDRLGVDGSYRVRICLRSNGRVLAETWSAANGDYLFEFLPYEPLIVYALDHTATPLNAAIADLVTPELMT